MQTSCKRLRIDHLIHMSIEAAPQQSFDDLADTACDLLDLCRNSGLEVGPESKMIELAIGAQNYTRLEKLIARVNAKRSQPQHGSVDASTASHGSAAYAARHSEPDTSSVAEPQFRIQTHNATIPAIRTTPEHYAERASLASFPAVPAYHVEPRNRRGPKPSLPRPSILVTTADVSSSRPDCGRDCKYPALRKFVFEQGLFALENGTLNDITIKSIVQKYKAAHPEDKMPNTIHACFQWDTLCNAVMANDVTLLTMQRQRAPTRDANTMQEKLLLRPELGPVVDWCMAWIRETRRAGGNPQPCKSVISSQTVAAERVPPVPSFGLP